MTIVEPVLAINDTRQNSINRTLDKSAAIKFKCNPIYSSDTICKSKTQVFSNQIDLFSNWKYWRLIDISHLKTVQLRVMNFDLSRNLT